MSQPAAIADKHFAIAGFHNVIEIGYFKLHALCNHKHHAAVVPTSTTCQLTFRSTCFNSETCAFPLSNASVAIREQRCENPNICCYLVAYTFKFCVGTRSFVQ